MKIHPSSSAARQRGVSLIECIFYIAMVTMVLGTALLGFNRCWDDSKHLRRNADDIVRALHAGEQWRTDIRAATGPIKASRQGNVDYVTIPVPAGQIVYAYLTAESVLNRQAGATARPMVVLDHVKASQMQSEPRQQVDAWRWELELQPTQKNVRMKPLFTFETVAGHTLVQ